MESVADELDDYRIKFIYTLTDQAWGRFVGVAQVIRL